MENKKVLLGMSGGVDSSVAAILLQEKGYEVTGVTLDLCSEVDISNNNSCEKQENEMKNSNLKENNNQNVQENNNKNVQGNNKANVQENNNEHLNQNSDAKNICNSLGIQHYTFDYKKEFKMHVINDFISCYANCKTPNPCIECNRYMKFGAMYEIAKKLGCNYIATGHYAKTEYSEKYNRWVLKKSDAGNKDQTYVLWSIPKNLIEHILFPLSNFESKEEIREIARNNNLEVANKPDSEDICFIPDGNYKKFLENNSEIKPKQGNIVNSKGEVLGKHTGLYNYTIGQRKGLGISYHKPLFVLGFNKDKNEVIVGEEKELYKKEILVDNINLLLVDEIEGEIEVDVKTRYSAKVAKAKIRQDGSKIIVVFDEPQRAITPGQSAVFYVDDIVLGGGKIVF